MKVQLGYLWRVLSEDEDEIDRVSAWLLGRLDVLDGTRLWRVLCGPLQYRLETRRIL